MAVTSDLTNVGVTFVGSGPKGPQRIGVKWYRKRGETWLPNNATLLVFKGKVDAAVGDKLTALKCNTYVEESSDWKMGKPGDQSSIKPATFTTFLVDADKVEITKGERGHSQKGSANPFPVSDHDENILPF